MPSLVPSIGWHTLQIVIAKCSIVIIIIVVIVMVTNVTLLQGVMLTHSKILSYNT